jgi:hypothetical protein
MHTNRILSRIIAGALLTGGVAIAGLGLASGSAQAESGLTPLVWQMDDPDDQPPTSRTCATAATSSSEAVLGPLFAGPMPAAARLAAPSSNHAQPQSTGRRLRDGRQLIPRPCS